MLREPRLKIDRRTNVMATRGTSQNINPSHRIKVPGGRIELPTKGL
jgi:hypothetical protein